MHPIELVHLYLRGFMTAFTIGGGRPLQVTRPT